MVYRSFAICHGSPGETLLQPVVNFVSKPTNVFPFLGFFRSSLRKISFCSYAAVLLLEARFFVANPRSLQLLPCVWSAFHQIFNIFSFFFHARYLLILRISSCRVLVATHPLSCSLLQPQPGEFSGSSFLWEAKTHIYSSLSHQSGHRRRLFIL